MKPHKKPTRSRAAQSEPPAAHQHGPKGPTDQTPHGMAYLRLVMRLSADVPDATVYQEAAEELETLRLKLGSKWQPTAHHTTGSPRQL